MIQKQSVAEHIFNVERLCFRIIYAMNLDSYEQQAMIAQVVTFAHFHEDLEQFSGDFPSMVKDCVDEVELGERYPEARNPIAPDTLAAWIKTDKGATPVSVASIVKVADYLEAVLFLLTEISMGNKTVERLHDYMYGRLMAKVEAIGLDHDLVLRIIRTTHDFDGFRTDHHDRRKVIP